MASVTTGVRRVGLASRSGITAVGPVRAAGEASGSPEAGPRRSGRRRRRSWPSDVRDGLEDRLVDAVVRHPDERRRRVLAGRRRRTSPRRSSQPAHAAGQAVLLDVRAVDLVERDDPVVRPVEGVDLARRAGRSPTRAASSWAPRAGACRRAAVGVPALVLAADEPDDAAVVGDEDVAVDVQSTSSSTRRGRSASQVGRLGREAAAVAGRRVGQDLLLRRVDDVQVVQAARSGRARTCRCP